MGDFNPGFSFDVAEDEFQHQAPWDFGEALKDADKPRGTSIDYKIQKRISSRPNANGVSTKPQEHQVDSEEDTSDDDDDDIEPDENLEDDEEEEDDIDAKLDDASDEEASLEIETPDGAEDDDDEMNYEEEDDHEEKAEVGDEDKEDDVLHAAQPTKKPRHTEGSALGTAESTQAKLSKGKKQSTFFDQAPQGTQFTASSFGDLNLSRPLVRACAALGYERPTPIQAACVPLALTGRDICGSAVTGSGKTAAFALPLLERLLHRNRRVAATYVLVLAPTRELAVQVHSMIEKLSQFTDIRAALVVGGLSLQSQAAALRAAPEIVVATPGRLIDHLRNSQGFGLEDLSALVLDEADRLLEMGFAEEVREIVKMAPSRRQTLLFSATMTEEVKALVALSLHHPVRLAADATAAAPSTLRQEIIRLKGGAIAHKEAILMALASRSLASTGRTIIFFSTKQRAHRAKILFGLATLAPAAELHGDMTQAARLESLEKFRKGEAAFLLATDVAARGLDILGVETVVNYDCPRNLASYLHRVGRTARAGTRGLAITFVEDGDRGLLKEVVKRGKVDLQQRKIAAAAISGWGHRIEKIQGDVGRILGEEREEKELRRAEMEATKAANILEHEAEIYGRPARTWFQTEKQKKEIAVRARQSDLDADLSAPGLDESIKRKVEKNSAKSARRMERKLAAAKEEAQGNRVGKRKPGVEDGMPDPTRMVRAVKARQAALREEGLPASKATKIAAAMLSGVKKKKKKDSQKPLNKLFDGDGLVGGKKLSTSTTGGGPGSRVYAGGAKTGKSPAQKSLNDPTLKRLKRGGKGRHSFKSKAKHKRR